MYVIINKSFGQVLLVCENCCLALPSRGEGGSIVRWTGPTTKFDSDVEPSPQELLDYLEECGKTVEWLLQILRDAK